MLGPALAQHGGIAAVERSYRDAWDHGRYELRHIPTYASHHDTTIVQAGYALRALLMTIWSLLMWRPDVLHLHVSWYASFYRKSVFLVLGRACRVPHVLLHCHASGFYMFYDASNRLQRWWIRRALRRAHRLIVLGEWWRRYYRALAGTIPIEVLPNPVTCPDSVGPYHERPPVVVTLGELGQRKGTYDTLRAIPEILALYPTAEFWLGGDGDVREVQAILDRESWGNRVKLLGWVEGSKKDAILSQARVFLLPSYHEGLPVAILEAMAYNVPVVATPVGSIPEAVKDGETGFLVEPGSPALIARRVVTLLRDEAAAERMGALGRDQARAKYDVGMVVQRLFAIYDLRPDRHQQGD
jgi:glycosyltransferase involved in cell wall biosynthesis